MHAFPALYAQCRYFNFYRSVVTSSIFLHLFFMPKYSIGSRAIIRTHTHRQKRTYTYKQQILSRIFQSGNLCKYFGQNINKKKTTRKPKSTWTAVHSIEFHAQHEHYKHNILTHTFTHTNIYFILCIITYILHT